MLNATLTEEQVIKGQVGSHRKQIDNFEEICGLQKMVLKVTKHLHISRMLLQNF